MKRGDDTASVPDDLAPDELTLAKALELLAAPKSDEPIGELDGYPVFAKNGRYGPYVQWGTPDDLPPGLRQAEDVEPVQDDDARAAHGGRGRGAAVAAADARRRPGRRRGDRRQQRSLRAVRRRRARTIRNLENEEQLLTITLDEALAIFAQPKVFRRGGQNLAAKGPLREFGTDPVSERPVVAKDGRFGVYVTDGETNASIGEGDRLEEMTPERAFELLAVAPRGGRRQGRPATKRRRKKSPAKKAPAKKRKAPAKRAGGQEVGGARDRG